MRQAPRTGSAVRRLLIVSNGYAEDLEVAQVIQALPRREVAVTAYPLVGLGRAYPSGVSLLDPRREFPSGGFSVRAGWGALWSDLRSGWLAFWAAQRRTLRAQRGNVDLVVAAGDVYCLWMAAAAGGPTVYLALPKSEYIGSHTALEVWMIRRAASQVFTRDETTAAALRHRGIPAQYVGFTLMDTLVTAGETFGLPPERPVLTLLPGSKPAAFENVILLLRAAAAVPPAAAVSVLLAWAPNLSRDELRVRIEAGGGRWTGPDRFRFDSIEAVVTNEHFADALARATVVLGMAGGAHEQAAGLGKPVITFPGTGPQVTARFLEEQKKLLGDALVVTANPEDAARAVVTLLADPAERKRLGQVGRERQGGPGGAARIAHYLLERLNVATVSQAKL